VSVTTYSVGEDNSQVSGPLLQRAIQAEAETIQLFAEPILSHVADMVGKAIQILDGPIWGASPYGDRLVGSVLVRHSDIRLWTSENLEHVVLIDGVLTGVARLEYVGWTLHQLGVRRVSAAVIGLDGPSDAAGIEEILVTGR